MIVTAKQLDETDIKIIQFYSEGMSAREIAYEMNLTLRQVTGRIVTMKRYYQAKSITHLVAMLKEAV